MNTQSLCSLLDMWFWGWECILLRLQHRTEVANLLCLCILLTILMRCLASFHCKHSRKIHKFLCQTSLTNQLHHNRNNQLIAALHHIKRLMYNIRSKSHSLQHQCQLLQKYKYRDWNHAPVLSCKLLTHGPDCFHQIEHSRHYHVYMNHDML